ncbi:titin isoform X3 [Labeo rohita]|uniref:titin isoform X3 n=1 Tax=Labeo rohita TaxID=84645 RepID=UPI0021E1D9D9|nr:titin isoform X3 [Labeo rohita]
MKIVSKLLSLLMYLLVYDVSDVDTYTVFVMEGDSVTIECFMPITQEDRVTWRINGNLTVEHKEYSWDRYICTDVRCTDRENGLTDRLKVNQDGSLTITNVTVTDSGDYWLSISSTNGGGAGLYTVVVCGVSAAVQDEIKIRSVMVGESFTLAPRVTEKTNNLITWYFNDTLIAEITGDQSEIVTNYYYWRVRDRLKLDYQTGSLTITNSRTTDSGDYKLEISSSVFIIIRSFSVTVTGFFGVGINGKSAFVMEGDSVTLKNDVTTNQQHRSNWYFQYSTGTYQISSEKTFSDTVHEDYHQVISEKIFSVTVHDVSVAERDQMKSKSLKHGESVTLDPGVITNPNDVMTWYFNDTLIAEITGDQSKIVTNHSYWRVRDRLKLIKDYQTGSLTITNSRITDSGDYQLQISSSRFNIIRSFSVTVTVFLGVSADGGSVSVMEGDSVTLHTGVETNQRDVVRWYFNDFLIAQITGYRKKICTGVQCQHQNNWRLEDRLTLDHQTGSLTITNIRTTDSGVYELKIVSRTRIISENSFNVTVHDVPVAERDQMKSKSLRHGESVTLDPGVITNPNDVMTWHFNDTLFAEITGDQSNIITNHSYWRVRDGLKLDHHTGSLTITNSRITDSGDYQLQISSSRFNIIRSFSVTVTVFLGVSADGESVSVMEGDSVTLHTGVETNQRDVDNERVEDRLTMDHQTGSLTITNIRTTDSGVYKLRIFSQTRRTSANSFNVTVHDVPAAERDQMKSKSLRHGQSVTLDPGVITNPNDVITWHFNDTLIAEITGDQSKIVTTHSYWRVRDRLKLDHQTGSLTITNSRTTDSGLYKLQISGSKFRSRSRNRNRRNRIISRISIIKSFSVSVRV